MPLALERSDKSQLEVPVEMDGKHLNRVANTHVKLQFESWKKKYVLWKESTFTEKTEG